MLYYNYYRFSSYIIPFLKYNNPIKLIKNRIFSKRYLKLKPIEIIKPHSPRKGEIDIYIIAFNKHFLIESQIYFLKKNLLDEYVLNVMDNSSDMTASNEIKNICINNNCNYVRLPMNKLEQSHSHWLALNYVMEYFILKSNSDYFWLLDHDCFLIKECSIIKQLKNQHFRWLLKDNIRLNVFNKVYNCAWNRRFLRPWCAFYRKNLFKKWYNFFPTKRFIPLSFLDTWWGNRKYIYKYYKKDDLNLLKSFEDPNLNEIENIDNYFIHIWWWGNGKNEIKDKMTLLYKKFW